VEPLSRQHRPARQLAFAALLIATLAGLTSASAGARPSLSSGPATTPATLVANGNFTSGLQSWRGYRARLARVRNGLLGPAVRLVPRRAGAFLYQWPRPVSATEPGTVYRAVAWVRSRGLPGGTVCLRLRAVAGGKVVQAKQACRTARRGWRRLGAVRLQVGCRAGAVGLSIRSPRRAGFELDAVNLRMLPGRVSTSSERVCAQATIGAEHKRNRSFLDPFPARSLWSKSLPADPAVERASADKIAYWLKQIRYPNMVLRAYATAIAVADVDSPTHTITCVIYACPDMNRFGPVPIPAGTRPDPSSDAHLAVWDPATHREWDFWISKCPTNCAHAGSGGSFTTDTSDPAVPNGANAANFPLLAGIVHPEEIAAGHIDHPLIFATPNVGTGRVCPAAHSDGKNTDPRALREGSLLQLDPGVDLAALPLPAWQKTIARAMQEYGMYLADGGGTLSIGAENPINRGDLWGQLGLNGDSVLFDSAFPWNKMRVLAPPQPWC
jgi:hypothetical protein